MFRNSRAAVPLLRACRIKCVFHLGIDVVVALSRLRLIEFRAVHEDARDVVVLPGVGLRARGLAVLVDEGERNVRVRAPSVRSASMARCAFAQ